MEKQRESKTKDWGSRRHDKVFWLRIKNVYFMDFLIQRQGKGKVGKGRRSFLKEKRMVNYLKHRNSTKTQL